MPGFFVGAGLAIQTGSNREVSFESQNRIIGANTYEDLSIDVQTDLKNDITPMSIE